MKKKASKKKVSRKPQCCSRCIYHVHPDTEEVRMGWCHRYPLASKCRPDHWCGEFKQR